MTGRKMGFVLKPGYSSIAYVSAIEPLLICNTLTGEDCYIADNFGIDSLTVRSSLNNQITVNQLVTDAPEQDVWFIVGPSPASYTSQIVLDNWLANQQSNTVIGGISSGTYDLARAGLLDGYRAVVHWRSYLDFPAILHSPDAFLVDRDRMTCRGGTSSLDMMMSLIARHQGIEVAEAVSQYFIQERRGVANQPGVQPLQQKLMDEQPVLSEAIALMSANVEEPLSADDIAFHAGISRRQLERLFKRYLNTVPSKYYLQLRMQTARERLLGSQDSIADIGYRCGFSSGAHFSTAYRNLFGLTPSEDRRNYQRLSSGEE